MHAHPLLWYHIHHGVEMFRKLYNFFQDLNGLLTVTDLLGWFGFWLYRGTWRRTMTFGIAMLTVVIVDQKFIGSEKLTLGSAFTWTALFFVGSCLGGVALMYISGALSRRHLLLSEVKGSNLIERMKQQRREIHREHLWCFVMSKEQKITCPDQLAEEEALIHEHQELLARYSNPAHHDQFMKSERLLCEEIFRKIGRSREGFDIEFDLATQVPISLPVMRDLMEFDMSMLIDWYDGAPFHHTDNKLSQQFDAQVDLRSIRHEIPNLWFTELRWQSARVLQKTWFKMITRAVQIRVAAACGAMDRKYAPYRFHADHFLWPTAELNELMTYHLGKEAVEDFTQRRVRLFRRVFRTDIDQATTLLLRGVYPNFQIATDLRRRYDPEYMMGELSHTWGRDARAHARELLIEAETMREDHRLIHQHKAWMRLFETYLDEHPLPEDFTKEAHRALRIMFHTNQFQLRDMILGHKAESRSNASTKRPRDIRACIEHAQTHAKRYSHHLVALRFYHELTRLEFMDYCHYVETMIQENPEIATSLVDTYLHAGESA